jgi:monoamine oxidase
MPCDKRVVVIGGGLGGLTTAYRLHQKGIDVQLYEAKEHVGGRVLTALINGRIAELGAQNLNDGGSAQHLYRLIAEFELNTEEYLFPLDNYFYSKGKVQRLRDLTQHLQLPLNRLDKVARTAKNMKDVLLELFDEEDPLFTIFSVRLAGFEGAPPEYLSPIYIETLRYMLLGGVCAVHANPEEIRVSTIEGGNSHLTEKIAQSLRERVHLNMALKKVSLDPKGNYELFFEDGQKRIAEILILAIPCGVYNDIDFSEGVIPKNRLSSIRCIHYGTNSKILIPLPSREKGQFSNHRIVAFATGKKPILTFYYTGDSARFSKSSIEKLYAQDCTEFVQAGFGSEQLLTLTPQLALDKPFASYECPIGYSWPDDPYIKGSYSFVSPGQEKEFATLIPYEGESTKPLFAPIDRKLFFVGEHASILLDTPSTMEAAVESGERIARIITKLNNF